MAFVWATPALAWDKHQALMEWVIRGMPESVQRELDRPFPAPCHAQDKVKYAELAKALELQPNMAVRPTAAQACLARRATTGREILLSEAADDPDNGMDRELADSADPAGDRKWMGGETGPNSQGFRHMYFGGWRFRAPVTTFQVPMRSVGQAPERTQILAQDARELFQKGERAWGFRVMAWAMHFVQDLSQPFHSVQIPNLKLVPWYALLTWPPGKAFKELVAETTRSISNYHYAYEGYTLHRMTQGDKGPFAECLPQARELSKLTFDSSIEQPKVLAERVAEQSIDLGAALGSSVIGFFGGGLRGRDHDLPRGQGVPNYAEISLRPDLMDQRVRLDAVTCRALANGIVSSRAIAEWVLQVR